MFLKTILLLGSLSFAIATPAPYGGGGPGGGGPGGGGPGGGGPGGPGGGGPGGPGGGGPGGPGGGGPGGPGGGGPGNPGGGGPISQCNSGTLSCCNQVSSSSNPSTASLLGLLGVVLQGVAVPIGLGCTPISVIGIGSGASCSEQSVCCDQLIPNSQTLVGINCSPIDIL